MMRGALGLAVVLIAVIAAGCTTRDPMNPLDSENPDTRGEPQWLDVRADHTAVDLSWEVPFYTDVREVLVRETTGDSVLWRGSTGSATFRHQPLDDGTEYTYRLELDLETDTITELPEISSEPGAEIPWTLDIGSGAAWRLTPDNRSTRVRIDAREAATLRTDPVTGDVLILDFFVGTVRLFDAEGNPLWVNRDFFRPLGALADPQGWWVADPGDGQVGLLDSAGQAVVLDTTFSFPVDLAPGPSGTVWVADGDGGVKILDRDQGVVFRVPRDFGFADLVAEDGAGGVWVYDAGKDELLRLDAIGNPLVVIDNLQGVVDLAADPILPGGVWFTDRPRRRVVLLNGEGVESGEVADLVSPSSIEVSPDGAELWIADPGRGGVYLAGRDGQVIRVTRGVTQSVAISVAFTPVR